MNPIKLLSYVYSNCYLYHANITFVLYPQIAFIGMMVGESFNPLFDGKISGPAIFQFQVSNLIIYMYIYIYLYISIEIKLILID
jgi:hypothetical protein